MSVQSLDWSARWIRVRGNFLSFTQIQTLLLCISRRERLLGPFDRDTPLRLILSMSSLFKVSANDIFDSCGNFACMYFGSSMLVVQQTQMNGGVRETRDRLEPSTSSWSAHPHELGCLYVCSRPASMQQMNRSHQMDWMSTNTNLQSSWIAFHCAGYFSSLCQRRTGVRFLHYFVVAAFMDLSHTVA